MQNKFNVTLMSFHPITVNLPKIGDVSLPAGREIQLLNASVDTINYLRNTFTGTGVSIKLNNISKAPAFTHDYEEKSAAEIKKEELEERHEPIHMSPFEKVANYEMPSGKYKGVKIRDIDDESLKVIARTTKTQMTKSAIEAYLNLK